MQTLSSCRFFVGLGLCFVFLAAPLGVNGASPGTSGEAPRGEPMFKAGDLLAVTSPNAQLMLGDQVVASLPKGERVVVVEVRDSWVGAYVTMNGQKKAGWIRATDFVPATVAGSSESLASAQTYTARRPVVAETATASEPSAVGGGGADDYFTNYSIGYYTRHETDPNVHEWEPWRFQR